MSQRPETPSQGIGIAEAASRFEALLSGEPENQQEELETAEQPTDEAEVSEETEALATDDASEETPADEVEADEEEVTEDDEEEADQPDELDKIVTVKIDGKDEQVTLREALAGYSRTAAFTRKSMALADEKRAFESEKEAFAPERDAIRTEREQYAQLLPALVNELKTGMQEPDWNALADNPTEYIRQQNLWRDRQERLAAAQEEQNRLYQLRIEEEKAAIGAAIRDNGAKLVEAFPQWKDPQKWQADRSRLIEYGKNLGFSEEELSETYDHRAVKALYKAMRYDEMMAKRAKPTPPVSPRPAPAGNAAQQPQRSVSELTRAKQRLSKTGRVQDAASIFEQML